MTNHQRLMRTWYRTDIDDNDTEYVGAFSDPFPAEGRDGRRIVDVDWATPGEVQVTWLIPDIVGRSLREPDQTPRARR